MDDSFASARGELEDDGDGDDDRARVDGARRRVDGARASGREGDDFGDDDDEDDEDDDDEEDDEEDGEDAAFRDDELDNEGGVA